jgi:hypothetical protein
MTTSSENQSGPSHSGERPTWDCDACTQPWPCANAKDELLQEFHGYPSVLAVYMSAQMCEAVLDLTAHGAEPPADLYERFLSWIHLASTRRRSVNNFPCAGHLQRRRKLQAA